MVMGGKERVAMRLVVSRMHVGCLLGKGGKIIEQMRIETKTQIRILPRDHSLPRCVSMSEEIVQVLWEHIYYFKKVQSFKNPNHKTKNFNLIMILLLSTTTST